MTEERSARGSQHPFEHGEFGLPSAMLPLPYLSLGPNGEVLAANEHYLGLTGYRRDEVIGSWFGDFLTPDSQALFKERFAQFKQEGHVENAEFHLIRKDGGRAPSVFNGTAEYDADGRFVRTHCLINDVAELRALTAAYRSLVDHSIQGLVILNRDGVLFTNEATARMSGYSVEELHRFSAEEMRNIVHPEDRDGVSVTLTRLLAGEEVPQRFEFRFLRKDGSVGHVVAYPSLVEIDGEPAIQVTYDDQSDRHQAEIALRTAEAESRALVDASPDYILMLDRDLKIRFANRAAPGLTSEDILGAYLPDLASESDRTNAESVLRGAIDKGQPGTYETSYATPEGETIYFESRVEPIRSEQSGDIDGIALIARDITARKRAERELKESQERFRLVFEGSDLAIALTSIEGEVVLCNEALERLFGYSQAELQQLSFRDFTKPEYLETELPLYEELLAGKRDSYQIEKVNVRKDGQEFWLRATISAIRGAGGRIVYLVATGEDITSRKRMEQALQGSEAEYQDLYDNAPNAYFSVGTDGIIKRCNRRASEMLGYSADQLIGMPVLHLYREGAWGRDRAEALLDRFRAGEAIHDEELQMHRADGSSIWISLTVNALRDASGTVIESRSMAVDIEARKRTEAVLVEERNRVERYLDIAGVMFVAIDRNGIVTMINQKGSEILGRPEAGIIGSDWFASFVPARDRDRVRTVFDRLMAGEIKAVEYYENPVVTVSGEERIIAWHNALLVDEAGRPTGTLSSGEDITERRYAEEALRESETQLRQTLEATTDGIWMWNFETDEMTFSPRYYTMLGYEPNAFPADFDHWLDLIHPEDRDAALATATEYLKTKLDDYENQFRLRTADGNYRWIRARARVVERNANSEAILMIGNHEDITERVEAEKTIRESAGKLRVVTNSIPVVVYSALPDEQSTTTFISGKNRDLTGYEAEEFLSNPKLFETLVHPDDREHLWEAIRRHRAEAGELDVEYRIRAKGGTEKWIRDHALPTVDELGEIVRIDGYMEDITERKQAADALRESEERWRIIAESSREIIWQLGLDGNLSFVSPSVKAVLGYEPEEATGLGLSAFIHMREVPRAAKAFAKAVAGDEYQLVEIEARHKNGSMIPIEVSVTPIRRNRRVIGVQGIARDITERIEAQEELERTLRTSDDIVRTIPAGLSIYQYEPPDRLVLLQANPAASTQTGIDLQEWIGKEFDEIWTEARARGLTDAYLEVMRTGKMLSTEDLYYEDERLSGAFNVRAFRLPGNRLAISFENVTERMRAEEELRASEEKYSTITESSADAIFVIDRDGRYTFANKAACALLGYSEDELLQMSINDVAAGGSANPKMSLFGQLLETGRLYTELELCRKDGRIVPVDLNAVVLPNGLIYGSCRDLTARKRIEQRFETAASVATDLIYEWDVRTDELLWFGDIDEALGFESGEINHDIVSWAALIHPEDRPDLKKAIEFHRTHTRLIHEEYRIRTKTGDWRYWIDQAAPILDREGRPLRWVGVCLDVTERVLAEQALRESEIRYRSLFEDAVLGIYQTTPDGRILTANPALIRMLGYESFEQLAERNLEGEGYEPETPREQFKALIEQAGSLTGRESAWKRRDGQTIYVRENARVVRDDDGKILYYEGTIEDVTERRRALRELENSEEKFRSVFENAAVGMAIGRISTERPVERRLEANAAYAEMLGYTRVELDRIGIWEIAYPEDVAHERKCFDALLSGETADYQLEMRFIRKDGTTIWGRVTTSGACSDDGKTMLLVVIIEDVTTRRLAEDELKRSAEQLRALGARLAETQEEERRRIARELHDQVSQNLTALSINAESIGTSLRDSAPEIGRKLGECAQLIEETAVHIRDLTFDLRPPVLDDFGLFAAIGWHAERAAEQTGLTIEVSGEEPAPRLPAPAEMALFRITQEALMNIVKHAQARSVSVRLDATSASVRLQVEDDGVGFDPSRVGEQGTPIGWGLLNMRERVEVLGGTLAINSSRRGTRVSVEVPR